MIRLIIKGSLPQATEAAIKAGVILDPAAIVLNDCQVVAKCDDFYEPHVRRWFDDCPFKTPYPVGTLLWFGLPDKEEAGRKDAA